MIQDNSSLIKTLDSINDIHLQGDVISKKEGLEIAHWIVAQQGQKGSYRGMSAPTQADFVSGIRTFTGERLASASARHITGQEAARVIWLLGNSDPAIRGAYEEATHWMHDNEEFLNTGTFCCGRCTLAFWRHYWVGDFEQKEGHLNRGLELMKNRRSGDGKWHRFPFHYAIYALLDIDLEPALAELRYARPLLEKYAYKTRDEVYSNRRRAIMIKALAKVT
jgi:hypothetical protein